MNRKISLLSILLLVLPAPATAGGGITGGATELTQIANNGELIAQVKAQIDTYRVLQQEFDYILANDIELGDFVQGGNFDRALRRLHQTIRNDSVISYVAENVHEDYTDKYPDYVEYTRDYHGVRDGGLTDFLHWENQNRRNVSQAMGVLNVNADQMLTEEQTMETLRRQARDEKSRKAIAQLGNNLALVQLEQSRRMENLLQTQIAMQANFEAAQADREMRNRAARDQRHQFSDEYVELLKRRRAERQRTLPSITSGTRVPRIDNAE